MNCKLYVGNLPYEVTESDLHALFASSGTVASVNVVRDRDTGRARGFAFVEMANENDARNAIAQLNERPFNGRTLAVNEARPQVRREGGSRGGYDGGSRKRSDRRW